jgi:tRNA threonylcarbamoyladenosine biosynthesis protein TsaE
MTHEVILNSLSDTERLGQEFAKLVFPGAIIALVGPLGAGKTTLTRAIAIGLGVESRLIASPTFALVHEYPGNLPVYHFDAYRLNSVTEFEKLGVEEYFNGHGICIIEWADLVAEALPPHHLQIELTPIGGTRRAVITAKGDQHEAIINSILGRRLHDAG